MAIWNHLVKFFTYSGNALPLFFDTFDTFDTCGGPSIRVWSEKKCEHFCSSWRVMEYYHFYLLHLPTLFCETEWSTNNACIASSESFTKHMTIFLRFLECQNSTVIPF